MRQLTGGIIGALAAGAIVTAWHARPAGEQTIARTQPAPVQLVSSTQPLTTDGSTVPVSVRCEPGQRAVLRQVPSSAGVETEAGCVTDAWTAAAAPAYAPALQPQARVVPASYVVAERPPAPRVERQAIRRAETRRTWKQRALVIGGSTGAGAGIGALAGGKKGALIGAAIGGGAATVYEITRH